jgi:hypothetical protein
MLGASPSGLPTMRRTAVLVDVPDGHTSDAWPAVMDADDTY